MKVKSESEVDQSCPTLSDPMDCTLPGSSAHGIFQARVLEWAAIAFSGVRARVTAPKQFYIQELRYPNCRIPGSKSKHSFFILDVFMLEVHAVCCYRALMCPCAY